MGGGYIDRAYGVAVDSNGNIYIAGATESYDFPVTDAAFQKRLTSNEAGFIAKLNRTGALQYSTLIQGENEVNVTECRGIAVDNASNVYVVGYTANTQFPTTQGAYSRQPSGDLDAFVVNLTLLLPVLRVFSIPLF